MPTHAHKTVGFGVPADVLEPHDQQRRIKVDINRDAISKILAIAERTPEITGSVPFFEVLGRCAKIEVALHEIEETCRKALLTETG